MPEDRYPPGFSRSQRRPSGAERDDVDYGHRHFINLLSVAFLLLLAVAMAWTVRALDQQESMRKCFASGRKDCIDIASPPKDMRQAVR